MGFLDKAFKNVFRGARDFINSPAGIATLAIANPQIEKLLYSDLDVLEKMSKLKEKWP